MPTSENFSPKNRQSQHWFGRMLKFVFCWGGFAVSLPFFVKGMQMISGRLQISDDFLFFLEVSR